MPIAHWYGSHWIGQPASAGINTPTLAVSDQGDGTGATATVSGSTAATTNTIYTGQFSGSTGSITWTSSGSRVADGTVDLSLAVGHYFAYCESTNGTDCSESNIVYFVVTGTTQAIYWQILDACKTRIQSISLSGIDNASIVVCKLPFIQHVQQQSLNLPCVLIAPTREMMPGNQGVTSLDDVIYGVHVVAFDADNKNTSFGTAEKAEALWREQIAKAFRSQRLSGVTEVINCTVEPMDFTGLPQWLAQYQACGMILKFTSREPRGI